MAATTYLSQPGVLTVNAVDLTDQASSVSLTLGYNSLTKTAFGDAGELMTQGLQTVEGTITLYADYGSSSTEETIAGEVGAGDTTIVVKKADSAVGADNPEWTITNTMIANYPITYTVGELQVIEVSFTGGTWVRDVTP